MRVTMFTEGTYPVVTGGVSTWCDLLVRGMPDFEFSVVALTTTGQEPIVWDLPENVDDVHLHALWGPPARPVRSLLAPERSRALTQVRWNLARFWDAALAPESPTEIRKATRALRGLAFVSDRLPIARALASLSTIDPILRAWQTHMAAEHGPLRVSDAVAAANIADRTLSVFDAPVPESDVLHSSSLGPSALAALGAHWKTAAPLLVSEHGVYVRERYLALHGAGLSKPIRLIVMALTRMICTVAYRQSRWILPVNRFNARWERRLGADPTRIRSVPNGVDPERFEPLTSEPDVPTISFVGRIDPLKDLETLIRAFSLVRKEIPDARLRLFGPVPVGNEPYREHLGAVVDELGVDGISWEGPSKGPIPAFEAGHIVALSSVSEGLPFTVIEAMMSGRATVNTDVGGVSECLDENQETGRLVPARDPEAFARACVELLTDHEQRHLMGKAARERALDHFTLERCIDTYRNVYLSALWPADGLSLADDGDLMVTADEPFPDTALTPEPV